MHSREPMKWHKDILAPLISKGPSICTRPIGEYGYLWIPMEHRLVQTRIILFSGCFLGVPDLGSTVVCYIQSAAPDSRQLFPTIRALVCFCGCCSLVRARLSGLSWAVLMRSDWSLFLSGATREPESSRKRNGTVFSCFFSSQ
jgi:hypothetical protein